MSSENTCIYAVVRYPITRMDLFRVAINRNLPQSDTRSPGTMGPSVAIRAYKY